MISDLATTHEPAVNGRGASVSPVQTRHMLTEAPPFPSPAGGGNIHTSHPSKRIEAEIITAARPLVVKEILALLGDDIPDPVAHAKYLDRLTWDALCARRDQLLTERQEDLKAEELRHQPELPVRPLRQKRFFYGRHS